ncbi:AraC family transcriptional regulator [Acrocarpospora pleiomorpha]|uniref:AraC family transcriptional regulator n=1 Tax=Acrocarpospora pleiomorpha TaxID=90975 RepID=A0A5M3XVC3_9ACTN|nr:AraC family transcriptional regulator [Acrocarpospora pleiomorpha]GES23989.1 AraC family transcriptional regulator [Acrocarpospora pleiomorpha]
MDALHGLLDGPRARDAFVLRAVMRPPWAVRVRDEAPLALVAIVRGDAWVLRDGARPVRLSAGDVVITRGPEPYTFADDPATQPQVVVNPGNRCETPDGADLSQEMGLGVRSWGNAVDGPFMMLIGSYEPRSEVSGRLLRALPPMLVASDGDTALVRLLEREIVKDGPGQEAVLDRLLDLLLITTLRGWFARSDAPLWFQAMSDPVVGRALRLLHAEPARPWTVASLAAAVGVSRAALARSFTPLVGQSPMAYLAEWRLTLAADLLREGEATVGAVAAKVGYGSAFALSTAFKRVRGVSPQEHRILAR